MCGHETYGIPADAGFPFQDLASVIAAAAPDASHDSLRRALTARWPALPWRIAAPEDEFTMDGGIVDPRLARVADNAASWLRQRIAEADDDYRAVWRRYKGDPSLLRTAFRGSTVWVFAPRGRDGSNTPLPRVGSMAIDAGTVARIIQARAARAGFDARLLGGHSLKRGALSTGMDRNIHPTRLKQLGRHKTYAVLDAYLELGDPFESHPLNGVL
jgi:hypothetical protein